MINENTIPNTETGQAKTRGTQSTRKEASENLHSLFKQRKEAGTADTTDSGQTSLTERARATLTTDRVEPHDVEAARPLAAVSKHGGDKPSTADNPTLTVEGVERQAIEAANTLSAMFKEVAKRDHEAGR